VPEREPELESNFVRAARPALRRISADLSDLNVSVVLTDASANVLVRADGGRPIRTRLDRVSLGPGQTYAEDTVDTNAILARRWRRALRLRSWVASISQTSSLR
jgi:sigma-54 dependent transcriptional regulator, acetoin dehydrogenase operon transcriptional activator AcoR